jgi:hypothetical protein
MATRSQTNKIDKLHEEISSVDAQSERINRIAKAQDSERELHSLKEYLRGNIVEMPKKEYKRCTRIADRFVLGADDVLYYVTLSTMRKADEDELKLKLVVPKTMIPAIFKAYHVSIEGGHQGIQRTYQKIRLKYYWKNMFADLERLIAACVDCQTAKGRPSNIAKSPGNITPTRPMQVIAMDLLIPLPKSYKNNEALLVFIDLFTSFIIVVPLRTHTAKDIAKAYFQHVYLRFGASEELRHDRDPRFMSEIFVEFSRLMKILQKATLAYWPMANGQAENAIELVTNTIRTYVEDESQRDWDEIAEGISFALNTSYNSVKGETPFYLMHGWDAKTTIDAMVPQLTTSRRKISALDWRKEAVRRHTYARELAHAKIIDAQASRAERHNEKVKSHNFSVGRLVWLYIPKVKPGYKKKLAHLWHGPFRITKLDDECKATLEVNDRKLHPVVHLSRLKLCSEEWNRPMEEIVVDENSEIDFDEALLPEDSFEPDPSQNIWEIDEIIDDRLCRKLRTGKSTREYLVRWKGFNKPSWVNEQALSCGGLLYDYHAKKKIKSRSNALVLNEGEIVNDIVS